jgi:hypothetical protein
MFDELLEESQRNAAEAAASIEGVHCSDVDRKPSEHYIT